MTSKKKGQEEGGTQCRQSGVLYREREREGRGRAIAQGNTPNIRQSVFRSGWSICAHGHGAGGGGATPTEETANFAVRRRRPYAANVHIGAHVESLSSCATHASCRVNVFRLLHRPYSRFTPFFLFGLIFFSEPIDSSAVRLFSRSVILFVCLKTTTRRRRTKFGHQRLQIRMNL